ncbi:hypothetical protein [Bacillus sp. NPDC094106]|uniref:hypothetical protein n=1 Tax=Bacillus sp. NPDC094106 TaxID=3363949 RepID=UPI003810EF7B
MKMTIHLYNYEQITFYNLTDVETAQIVNQFGSQDAVRIKRKNIPSKDIEKIEFGRK